MKPIIGTRNRMLDINLSNGAISEFQIDTRDRRRYLGGKGLGLKLLYDRMDLDTDPLGEHNTLAFMMGVLMGTGAPCSGRFSAVTKSPLTGIMVHSSCGGPFGMAFKTAGFDGLLITGKAASPVVIDIDANGARIKDGSDCWGLNTRETQGRLNPGGKAGVLTIGPAGEHQVPIANVASGHRFLGRGGLGAVMGAKNLKAIVAQGNTYTIIPADQKRFDKVKKQATAYINRNPVTADAYRNYGTGSHVNWCNDAGILPVKNFKEGRHPEAAQVSGEAMQRRYRSRPSTCKPCSIMCGHKGALADGDMRQIPEYETVGLMGPNLGIFEPDAVTEFNEHCGLLGLDTISTGSVLAWCMEAGEKGLIDTDLAFGATDKIVQALTDIAYRRGFGGEMAGGTRRLSEKYGGKDFAIHVKGLELPAYDPRGSWGQGLAYAVANRGGCHLSATSFALEVAFGFLNPFTTRVKARFVRFLEDLYAAVNSLHTCQFTSYAYLLESPIVKFTPRFFLRLTMQFFPAVAVRLMDVGIYARLWQSVTGLRLSRRQLLKTGARIHVLERFMNTQMGITYRDDTLPRRFLSEGRGCDDLNRTVPLKKMLSPYYRIRGYDPRGLPTPKTMKRMGIAAKKTAVDDKHLAHYRMVATGTNPFKRTYLTTLFWFMGRAIQAASRFDKTIKDIFGSLPDGFTFVLTVAPEGPAMVIGKNERGRVKYLGSGSGGRKADLTMIIKNIEAAMLLFSFQEATLTAVARNRLIVDGDLSWACAVVRILDVVEVYLLPRMLALLAVRRYPQWSVYKKVVVRPLIYLRALSGI